MMNPKWLGHYREKHGASENQVADAFFKSGYEVLTESDKTELNKWIDEQREAQDNEQVTQY